MNTDTYNSLPFEVYFKKNSGATVEINFVDKILFVLDSNKEVTAKVNFSESIMNDFKFGDLMNIKTKGVCVKRKIYYVYEKGAYDFDWLWYDEVISIADIFILYE